MRRHVRAASRERVRSSARGVLRRRGRVCGRGEQVSGSNVTLDQDAERRAAVARAIASITELRSAALTVLPERSRGRRRIVEACDLALASAGDAVRGMGLGDEPGLVERAWQASLDAARRAYQFAETTVREVAYATEEFLTRTWQVTAQKVREVKDAVASTLSRAVEAARNAVEAAYRYAVDTASQKLGIAVVLLGLAAIYFLKK